MAKHLLIDRSFKFDAKEPRPIEGWVYRRDIGAWVDSGQPDHLMVDQPVNSPQRPSVPQPRPTPQSKKADFETGEDMKGP